MISKVIKLNAALFLTLSLGGCAAMNGSFSCNKTAGSNCTPVAQVNALASSGYYNQNFDAKKHLDTSKTVYSYERADSSGLAPSSGEPVRSGERVQRIWIAPYQDKTHTYHGSSTVYSVLEKSHWIGSPVQELDSAGMDEGE